MTAPEHDKALVGAYVLGVLSPEETASTEAHLESCPECRRELEDLRLLHEELGEVPPEAFLDGPPEGGDLLLQRTLREVRGISSRQRAWGGSLAAAGLVAVVALSIGAGVFIGNQSSPGSPGGVAAPTATPLPSGTKHSANVDPVTGAHLAATVIPANGWIKVQVQASDIAPGQRCKLFVTSKTGEQQQFGGWLVGANATPGKTITLDGTALMSINDVASVSVVNDQGKVLVNAPV
ncbi:anti-sigma factor family protein [Kutzneria sp. CA-103260]|uniref:anti-sigma factor family protein n=1 Tax=Kutzneria sp. CA-103260 TaxID=2802641 RepID=UPI001BAD32DC|nr:zf-HC2 domain-containing protein [Kutzneria sp. CA-103260]QUQ72559.1 zf-HC2 domain-containing protein [Kutzneria sp. CA-103260]